MKKLFPFLLLFSSCSTLHKTVTTQKKTVDNTATSTVDTSYKSKQSASTDNLQVKDVDITVTYADSDRTPADSALTAAKAKPADRKPMKTASGKKLDDYASIIEDAVANAGTAGNIASVTIHIGSISDSDTHTLSVDTGSSHIERNIKVKDTSASETKTVVRTGLPWYVYALGGFLLIVLFVFIGYKIYKKFSL